MTAAAKDRATHAPGGTAVLARRDFLQLSSAAAAAVCVPWSGAAAQGDTITWKVVANTRLSSQFTVKWAWMTEELLKRTDGRFKLDVVSFSELGMTGQELVRMLNIGLVDAGEVVTGYVSGEIPIIEGAQMVGCYENLKQAQAAYEAWMDRVVVPNAAKMGGKPISTLAFTTQMLWSKFPVNELSDLKDKKIRIFAKAQADFVAALGAAPVSMPIAEVYSALERGVIDGAVTGPEIANGFKYEEVVDYVTDLLLGPGAGYVVVSEQAWNKLPDDIRGEFEALLPRMREISWEVTTSDNDDNLKALKERGLTVNVPAKPEWIPECKRIAAEVVVPQWVERTGPEGREAFNEAIGPIVGFTV
jgi:TRAP-type C4-dicarboxylate transport system substrate-binding protein